MLGSAAGAGGGRQILRSSRMPAGGLAGPPDRSIMQRRLPSATTRGPET